MDPSPSKVNSSFPQFQLPQFQLLDFFFHFGHYSISLYGENNSAVATMPDVFVPPAITTVPLGSNVNVCQ